MRSGEFAAEAHWEIDGATRLLAVLGDPVSHSLSPAMHNLALRELGLNYRYLALRLPPHRLAEGVRGLVAAGLAGCNATIPHKEALLGLMDELDAAALAVGAVNTVCVDASGRMIGYNTDVYGFMTALEEVLAAGVAGLRVAVLGAGGAARAVVAGLLAGGVAELLLVNRTQSRAKRLVEQLAPHFPVGVVEVLAPEQLPDRLSGCRLLVNTTSVGLHGEGLPAGVALARLPADALVQDIVYGRQPPPLVSAARAHGLRAADGLAMLVYQGAAAFRLWTGHELPAPQVTRHLRRLMGE